MAEAVQFDALIRENESFHETFVYTTKTDTGTNPVDISDASTEIYASLRDAEDSTGNMIIDMSLASGHITKTGTAGEFSITITLAELLADLAAGTDYWFDVVVRTGLSPDYRHKYLFTGRVRRSGGITVPL